MAILGVFVMYVKMLLWTAQMWIKNASVISKTLRSSLNCFLAFSWFSSSGVYNTSVNNLLCIIMLQLDKLFCPKKIAKHTHHCWVENLFDVSNKILPRQRSQRLLLVASFFNKCFHFGHQINLFPSLFRGSKESVSDNIRLKSTERANSYPALLPLHDSIRLGRSKSLHLHLAVHPAWHRRAQDLELHLLRSRRLVRRLKRLVNPRQWWSWGEVVAGPGQVDQLVHGTGCTELGLRWPGE